MSVLRRVPSLLLLLTFALAASGCPVTLEDDFHLQTSDRAGSPAGGGDGDRGGTEASGASDSGGAPEPSAGDSAGGSSANGGTVSVTAGDGAGGEAGAGGTDVCACAENETCCDSVCTDLRFDWLNCKACGKACPGTTCDNGNCTNECAFGRADCNRNLIDGCEVDPAIDPQNCGNCGIACGFQLECVAGECVCPLGTADCDGVADNGCETDITSDARSCGACGTTCNVHETCVSGECECAAGFADCNLQPADGCEASLTSAATCGSCTLDCGPHGACVGAGQCDCLNGYLDCDAKAPGCETAATDPAHCGQCDEACTVALPACDGTGCSTGCGALTKCGASCVNLQQDPQNCGACDKAVGSHQICVDGKPECMAGFGDCDADPGDCETDVDNDAEHCGDCGTTCKAGALCTSGSCACAPTTPNDCGASCEKCCGDAQCSDGNSCTTDTCNGGVCSSGAACAGGGVCCAQTGCFECCGDGDCTGGKICSGNKCVALVCTPPQVACNQKCVNPSSDAGNCGGCGNSCGAGRTCSASSCGPKWVAIASAPAGFAARQKAAYTALGSKVFVWGGVDASGKDLADGALYDPASDSWSVLGTVGYPPSARVLPSAVWTGSVVVVWGGGNAADSQDYTSGGRYDPVSDSWQPISTTGAPSGTRAAHAFWTGSRVLIYGGYDEAGNASAVLSLYDPVNDVWSSTTTNNRPTARIGAAVTWSGSQLLVYGGLPQGGFSNDTYAYDPSTNTWAKRADGPTARSSTFAAWDGGLFFVWGGASPGLKSDGEVYAPALNTWDKIAGVNAPSARWSPRRQAGWTVRVKPSVTLLVGGLGTSNTFFRDGGLYNSATKAWTPVSAWPSANSHQWGVGVWTGSELVIWGGLSGTGSTLTAVGERYLP